MPDAKTNPEELLFWRSRCTEPEETCSMPFRQQQHQNELSMKEFKLTPEGRKQLQKRQLLRTIPIFLLAGGIGLAMSRLGPKGKETDLTAMLIAIFILTVYISFSLYRGVKRQRQLLESYTLSITSTTVMREMANTPPVCLYATEIREIVRAKSGAFTLRGKERTDVIYIPCQINDYAAVESALESIRPIADKSSRPRLQKYAVLLPFLTLGLMVCVFTVMNRMVVAVSGTLFLAMMLWGFRELQRNRNIDNRAKRRLWWMVPVLLFVGYTMYAKLTGLVTE